MADSPMDRATAAIGAMESVNEKITVAAVRSRSGVSMEAARLAVESWRAQRTQPVVAVTDAAQQSFTRLWAVAVSEADARHADALEASRISLEAARAEAVEAGALVDEEGKRVKVEADRAQKAEARVAELEDEIRSAREAEAVQRTAADRALETARAQTSLAREEVAELRGRLAVLTEQATRYWDTTLPQGPSSPSTSPDDAVAQNPGDSPPAS
ncbi:hypothetical protein [Paeniglutamicibacter antarcticus]|uniref:KfrA N-terminal DNA-binding domain-containing protein n=1 Tax=Paeniglutamicibacter antarcticus TaxID=494023 RepID=A0ABP9TPH1_9MICC